VLAVRLWSAAGKRLDCRWSRSSGPLSGLVVDTIRASGGVTGAENGDFIAASFVDVTTGLQCARRIQWAVEGLSEYEATRGAAAAILVDAGEPGQQLAAPGAQEWEGVDAGKIVLRGGACEALDGVPGVALGAATAAGWREWGWRSSAANASFASDEQSLLGMLRTAGRSDPAAGATAAGEDAAGAPTRVFSGAMATGAARQPAFAESETAQPGFSRFLKMPIVAGAVAALLLVVVVVFFLTRKSPVQSAAPSTPAGQESHSTPGATPAGSAPAAAQNQPAHASTPNATPKHTKLTDMLKKLTPGGDQKTVVAPPLPVVASSCGLTDEVIQRSLARADQYLNSGDLTDARASYQHVVGCPSARDRAQAGLERIRKMAALNGAPN
jgi:hypothetical protein